MHGNKPRSLELKNHQLGDFALILTYLQSKVNDKPEV